MDRLKLPLALNDSRFTSLPQYCTSVLSSKSERPRIAMVSTHGYVAAQPPLGAADTGGQVVYVLELSKQLALLGYEVDIWTRRFEDQAEVEPVSEHVRILRMECGGNEFIPKEYLCHEILEWSENAIRFIKKHALTYEFINTHYWDAGIAGQHLCKALEVPHVHTPHSLGLWKKRQMEHDYPGDITKFEKQYNFTVRIRSECQLYSEVDMVVATSPQQLDLLIRDYRMLKERCQMIPPGYDDNRFFPVGKGRRDAIRRRLGFEGKVVMAIGRLALNKGYDLLIQGFSVLASREPDAVLYLAVGGVSLTSLEEFILSELQKLVSELDLGDKVRFRSFISDCQLADYYRAADVFVLSSRYEPFGMTAIEAMASGTPTVVTVHGGLFRSLTFGRDALFADPCDREDLGITMLNVFRYPELRECMSQMGAQKARSLFTWTGIAQQLVNTVEQRPTAALVLASAEWDAPFNDGD